MSEILGENAEFKDSAVGKIPKDWEAVELLNVVPKAEYGISVSLDDEKGIPVLRMNNIFDGEINITDLKKSASPKAEELLLNSLDVLFNRTNSIEHVGRTGIWRGQLEKASFASYLVRLVPDQSRLQPEYLNFWLNLPQTQILIRKYATPGVHQVNINPTNLRKVAIILPQDTEEQQKIAEILDTVEKAIALTQTHINKLKLAKAGLLHDLLTKGIDEHGELRNPKRNPEQFKDSPLGKIPKDWDDSTTLESNLSFITDYRGMTPPYTQEGIPVISAENVGNGRIKSITKYVNPETYKIRMTRGFPEANDVIFTTEAPVGEVALFPLNGTHMLTRRVIALRPNVSVLQKKILYWYLFTFNLMNKWKPYYHGSTVPRILKPDILGQKIPLPTSDEQDKIIKILDSHESYINSKELILEKLKLLKLGLMSDLLTGKVRVKI